MSTQLKDRTMMDAYYSQISITSAIIETPSICLDSKFQIVKAWSEVESRALIREKERQIYVTKVISRIQIEARCQE